LSDAVDPHFFVLSLRQAADSGRLQEYFTGATFKHLTGAGIGRFSFPLPPLAEQQRIVAKVDELMAVCDQLEAAQEERERRRAQWPCLKVFCDIVTVLWLMMVLKGLSPDLDRRADQGVPA
jgi:restriction endonuclease S subunit